MAKALTAAALEKLKPGASRREIPDGLLAGLYHVIQPSGARSWAVRYRAGGKPRKLTLGPYPAVELADARKRAQEALMAVQKGSDPATVKQDTKRQAKAGDGADRLLFPNVVRLFFARYAKAKNRAWRETARSLGLVASKAPGADVDDPIAFVLAPGGIGARWQSRSIAEIKRRDILAVLDEIVDRGSPIAANRTLAALRKVFNWSIERDLIDASPCSALKAPSPEVSRDRVLSDDEIRWFSKATLKVGIPFGPLARLLLLTGQRRDEVAGMTDAELDFEGRLWTIPKARAKNDQEHHVPLADAALAEIEALPRIASRAGFLFTTNGETHVNGWSRAKANLDREMLAIARDETKGKITAIDRWTLHDLRRTAASGMARLGIAVHVVERLLNHRSGTIRGVAAVYNRHDYWSERRTAADAWGQYVTELASGTPSENVVRLKKGA